MVSILESALREGSRTHAVDAIYMAPHIIDHVAHVRTAQWLRDTTASPYIVPNLLAFDLLQPCFIEIQGIPELAVCETQFWGTRPCGSHSAWDCCLPAA
jgi:putative colanic acid biosysnthesis UDP-glucose lipid carrier transferase